MCPHLPFSPSVLIVGVFACLCTANLVDSVLSAWCEPRNAKCQWLHQLGRARLSRCTQHEYFRVGMTPITMMSVHRTVMDSQAHIRIDEFCQTNHQHPCRLEWNVPIPWVDKPVKDLVSNLSRSCRSYSILLTYEHDVATVTVSQFLANDLTLPLNQFCIGLQHMQRSRLSVSKSCNDQHYRVMFGMK